jgi:hypothetical protein
VISIHTARYGNTTIGDATVLGQSGDRAGRYVPDRLHRCEQTERMSRESPAGRHPLLVSRWVRLRAGLQRGRLRTIRVSLPDAIVASHDLSLRWVDNG